MDLNNPSTSRKAVTVLLKLGVVSPDMQTMVTNEFQTLLGLCFHMPEASASSTPKPTVDGVTDGLVTPKKSRFKQEDEKTAATERRNKRGETALHLACKIGDAPKVTSLIDGGADVNAFDERRRTPLHEAANNGFVEIVQLLITAGALLNVPGDKNNTPLHHAVSNNHIPVADILLQSGADQMAKNLFGKTPRDFAITDEMRAALMTLMITKREKTPNGQPVSAVNRSMIIYSLVKNSAQRTALTKCVNLFNLLLVNRLTRDVTHLVIENNLCKRSETVLHALLKGVTLISNNWSAKCILDNCFVDPLLYEISGTTNFPTSGAPQRARLNAQNQLPGLWNGMSFFIRQARGMYVLGDMSVNKLYILNLIKMGGGQILSREPKPSKILHTGDKEYPYHVNGVGAFADCSHVILYPKGDTGIKHNLPELKTIPIRWLFDCCETFDWLDPKPYLL